ncbi:MAG TPA: MBL fold metallo-hydrolase [Solirubrobacteraceae bacterium]|jgi:L-ascorbate metabolism protein UlaG (beta-lactamase superfamily)
MTWLGHATVLLDIDGTRLLTDPVLGDRIGPLVRVAASVRFGTSDALDGVLISHLHADHADVRSLRRLARSLPVLAPRGAGPWLTRLGLREVHELSAGDEVVVGSLRVRATPAEHGNGRRPMGPKADPIGFVVGGSRRVYFAGDTDLFAAMAELKGLVDVALLPIWGWGRSLGPGHLDPTRAAEAAALIAPTSVVPIHWGTFALPKPLRPASDGWLPARQFAAAVRQRAPGVEVRIVAPTETVEL